MEAVAYSGPSASLPPAIWRDLEELAAVTEQTQLVADEYFELLAREARDAKRCQLGRISMSAAGARLILYGLVSPLVATTASVSCAFAVAQVTDLGDKLGLITVAGCGALGGVIANYVGTGLLPHKSSERANAIQDQSRKLREKYLGLSQALIHAAAIDRVRCLKLVGSLSLENFKQALEFSEVMESDRTEILGRVTQAVRWVLVEEDPSSWELWSIAHPPSAPCRCGSSGEL